MDAFPSSHGPASSALMLSVYVVRNVQKHSEKQTNESKLPRSLSLHKWLTPRSKHYAAYSELP
jgi:hypothetical protein